MRSRTVRQRMTRHVMKTWRKRRQKSSHGSDKLSPKKRRLVGVSAVSPHIKVNTTNSVISGRPTLYSYMWGKFQYCEFAPKNIIPNGMYVPMHIPERKEGGGGGGLCC